MAEEQKIGFKQLVEVRKEEMQGILPGFMSEVTDGKNVIQVYSPDVQNRSNFRMKEDDS